MSEDSPEDMLILELVELSISANEESSERESSKCGAR